MLAITIFVTLVLYSTACLGLGSLILLALPINFNPTNQLSPATKLATAFLLGQGFLANLWLLLALPGWFSPIIVAGIVSALALCGLILTWHSFFYILAQLRSVWRDLRTETWGWKITYLLTLVANLAWITSLGRQLSFDAASFYMALSKVIAETYVLEVLPGLFEDFTSIGLQAEMHFAALISMGSADAARLFGWPTTLAGAVMLLALARQVGLNRRGQWIALAILFTSSAVFWLNGAGKTDLFAAAFGLAAFYWTMQLRYAHKQSAHWLVGFFSGFAIVAKISYILALAPGIVFLMVWAYLKNFPSRNNTTFSFQEGLQLLGSFLIAIVPHMIKNGILFQNPFAPFGIETQWLLNQTWHQKNVMHHILLTYPLAITFGNFRFQEGNLSPLVLAFLPLVLLLPRPRSLKANPLIAVSLAALISILVWVIGRPAVFAPRYMLASLLLLILPVARAAEYVSQNEHKPRWLSIAVKVCIGITIVGVGLAYHNRVYYPLKTYQYLSNKISECDRDSQSCEIMSIINNRVPLGTRLFTNSKQRYSLRTDLIQCLITHDEIDLYRSLQSDEARWEFIYNYGYRYIIKFNNPEIEIQNFLLPSIEKIPDWLSVVTIEQIGGDVVMRLQARDLSHETGYDCYQQSTRTWSIISPDAIIH